jgi:hypothetical protein
MLAVTSRYRLQALSNVPTVEESGVPAFKGQQVSVARSDNELARMSYITVVAEREMTVQDLLRHTAGLAYGEITVNAPVRDAYAKAGLYLAGVRDYDARELTPAERSSGSPRRRSRISRARCGNTAWRSICSVASSKPRLASVWRTFSTRACSSR